MNGKVVRHARSALPNTFGSFSCTLRRCALGLLIVSALGIPAVSAHHSFISSGRDDQENRGTRNAAANKNQRNPYNSSSARPEIISQIGHANLVMGFVFSPDGRFLASCSIDKSIKLWELLTGREVRTFSGHTGPVDYVIFTPDGNRLISSSTDGTIRFWDITTGEQLKILNSTPNFESRIAISPDGRWLASTEFEGPVSEIVKVWSVESGDVIKTLTGFKGLIGALRFSPDGKLLALIDSRDNSMSLWDVSKWTLRLTINDVGISGPGLAFSKDSRLIASIASEEQDNIRIWDVKTGKPFRNLRGHKVVGTPAGSEAGGALSPDGRFLATKNGRDHQIRLWDTSDGHELRAFSTNKVSSDVEISGDGRWLAAIYDKDTIKIWETATGKDVYILSGHSFGVASARFSVEGQRLILNSHGSGKVLQGRAEGEESMSMFDRMDGSMTLKWMLPETETYSEVSPDGHWLASVGVNSKINIWETDTKRLVHTLSGPASKLKFSRDSRLLASTGDKMTNIWDIATGNLLQTLRSPKNVFETLEFSPNGSLLASASYDEPVTIWDVETSSQVREFGRFSPARSVLDFSPDGRLLALSGIRSPIIVWEVATGTLALTLSGQNKAISGVIFGAQNGSLISASNDGTFTIWDLDAGNQIRTFGGGNTGRSVPASSDGRWLVSATFGNTVRMWNAATGKESLSVAGESRVYAVAISHDGRWIASAQDRTIKLWNAATGQEVREMHSEKFYDLSDAVLAFSPDGGLLASRIGRNIIFWDVSTGNEIRSITTEWGLYRAFTFRPDGRWIAFVDGNAIRICDVSTGQEIRSIAGSVSALAFSPDGRWIVSGGGGNIVCDDARAADAK